MRDRAAGRIEWLRDGLDRSLFPRPPAGRGFERWEGALLLVAFLALAVVLQLFRAGPEDLLESIWAEDGPVFLLTAQREGFFDALTSTYAGYMVVVPRLIAEAADFVPLSAAAPTMTLGACLAIALSGLAVWVGSAGHIRSPYLRGLLVALTVFTPVASLEAIASASYVSWYMAFASFWLLLWRARTTWGAALAALFILATGLSSPTLFFFAPLAALRALAADDRRDVLIAGAFFLALAIQLPTTATTDENAVTAVWTSDIWTSYMQRVVDGAVFGEQLGGELWVDWGWPFLIAIVVAAAAALLVAAVRSSSGRLLAAIAVLTSVVMFVVSSYQRAVGTAMMWPDGVSWGLGGRYAIVPSLLLISAALVLLDRSARPPWSLRRTWPGILSATVLLVSLVTSFGLGDSAIRGEPSWRDSLEAAARSCGEGEAPEAVVATAPPGYGVPISCDRLESEIDIPPRR